jgi:hypothetical protein
MHIKLKMRYKGKLTKVMHVWRKICRSKWHLMKNYANLLRRLKRKNPAIMILLS